MYNEIKKNFVDDLLLIIVFVVSDTALYVFFLIIDLDGIHFNHSLEKI